MIPISDTPHSRSFPIVNYTLIAINIIVFFYELSLGSCTGFQQCELNDFIDRRGVIPGSYLDGGLESVALDPFTSMFIHAGWLHIIGNLLFLWVFGDNVEDSMGHWRYLLFYLVCGYLASLGHVVANSSDDLIPAIGASGAISGVLAAYLLIFPKAMVTALLPLLLFIPTRVPAFLMIGLWFFLQLTYGVASFDPETSADSTAYFAHIGGFAAGLALVWFFRGPVVRSPYERALEHRDSWP